MREVSCQADLPQDSSSGGALVALVLSGFLSLAGIYCLNRYLGPIDDLPQTTGSLRHLPIDQAEPVAAAR